MINQEDDDCFLVEQYRINSWLLSNFSLKNTGVNAMIHISEKQQGLDPFIIVWLNDGGKNGYGTGDDILISIDGTPEILAPEGAKVPDAVWGQLLKWIKLNRRALQRHWEGVISTFGALRELKKI